jgi:protein SERAC1
VDSAVLQLPDSMETKIPLHLDHSQMVKFDNTNLEGYKCAVHYLAEFEKNAPTVVASRFCKSFELNPQSI